MKYQFSLLLQFATVKAFLVLELLARLVGVYSISHFFVSELDDLVFGKDTLLKLCHGLFKLLLELALVPLVFCTLTIKLNLHGASDFTVKCEHIEI